MKSSLKSHSFRIGYITSMFKAGIEGNVIKDIMSHKTLNTTLKYNRNSTSPKIKIKALEKLF